LGLLEPLLVGESRGRDADNRQRRECECAKGLHIGQTYSRVAKGESATMESRSAPERKPHARSSAATRPHSHSIVPGGLLVMSYTTRLIPRTELMIRDDARARTSCGMRDQ